LREDRECGKVEPGRVAEKRGRVEEKGGMMGDRGGRGQNGPVKRTRI
jgi:hypothetical protein